MSNRYNATQSNIVDQDNRNMAAAGIAMSSEINALWSAVDTGPIGIQSDARDIDSMARGGGAFTWDNVTAPGNSLLFAWNAGRILLGSAVVTIAAGSLSLTPSVANYVEADAGGTPGVYANTAGFTAGRVPLYVITPGTSSYTLLSIVSAKAFLTQHRAAIILGSQLSTAGATKEIAAQIGAVAATVVILIPSPNVAATVAKIVLVNATTITQSDTDYWSFSVLNLGPAGTGTTPVADVAAANKTTVTGGAVLTAGVGRSLVLDATSANLTTAAGDVLQLTITKTGSPAALASAAARVDFVFSS